MRAGKANIKGHEGEESSVPAGGGGGSNKRGRTLLTNCLSAAEPRPEGRWKDSQTPSLHLHTSLEKLAEVCLLVAIFDYDYGERQTSYMYTSTRMAPDGFDEA